MPKALSARIFVALIIVSGFLLVGKAVLNVQSLSTPRFVAIVVLAVVAAKLKVKLPSLTGTMSVNLPFILMAAAILGTAEAVIVGFVSTFAQCLSWDRQKLNPVQLAFNCCTITLAVTVARLTYVSPAIAPLIASPALRLAVAATGYFLVNTAIVAVVISLTEKANFVLVWKEMFQLAFVYLVASAGVAGLALTAGQGIDWQVPLAVLPVMMGVFYSYRRYFGVIAQAQNAHVEAAGVAAGARV
ncbi:MAG TPA: hypothetical protein VKH81_15315 [Candidatus Angelobacter sp.]|nr:hypothetical protein [Candidatus Angelobacter sp.]